MVSTRPITVLLGTTVLFSLGFGQGVDNSARTIYQALSETLNCGQFKSLIKDAGPQVEGYYMTNNDLTLFAPNDTAFQQMVPYKRNLLFAMSPAEKENYVKSYTLPKMLGTRYMEETLIEESLGGPGSTNIFFYKRDPRRTDIISDRGGRTEYYANGALIYRGDIRVLNGVIHMLDRVLDPIISSKVEGYIRQKNMKFVTEMMGFVTGQYYKETITPLIRSKRFTLFVPTNEAIERIPREKLEELRSKEPYLAQVIRQHMIPHDAVYTSFVYHNQGYRCGYGNVVFKKIRDLVYVSAGGVSSRITAGNATFANGVIQYVDNVLGFVYKTAREQVHQDPELSDFRRILDRGQKVLQDFLVSSSGVTVFAPINSSFDYIRNLPGVDFYSNQTLIDYVLRLHLLEPGTKFEITNINGDYSARIQTRSQYRGWNIKIYSQGNETWVEGGYVKARVIRPDVGVTNGLVQYIDGILGVPIRDVPGIIFCEDWLIKSSYMFSIAGLNDYMTDPRIRNTPPACRSDPSRYNFNYDYAVNGRRNTNGLNSQTVTSMLTGGACRPSENCEFTAFVPNGTTVDHFQTGPYGDMLFKDNARLRYVLRRHIAPRRKIYIDKLSRGVHFYTADTGETVRFNKISDKVTEIMFRSVRARIIHFDLGATNGVIHIIDNFLFTNEDLTASSQIVSYSFLIMLFCLLFSIIR